MDREIPNANVLVASKIQQKNLQLHYQRLQEIKSHGSSRLGYLSNSQQKPNRKALQQQEERKTEIEKNNVLLFNKMMRIMKRPDPCNQGALPPTRSAHRPPNDLSRIQEQNRTMYERLERQKPTIDHRKHQEDRRKNENILKFLGKYSAHSMHNMQPYSLRGSQATRTSQSRPQTLHNIEETRFEESPHALELRARPRYDPCSYDVEEQIDEEEFRRHIEVASRAHKIHSSSHEARSAATKPDSLQNLTAQLGSRSEMKTGPPHSAKDIVLFKTKRDLSGLPAEVSIIRKHNTYEIRARGASQAEGGSFKMVLSEEEGNCLLEDSNYNYKEIVSRLAIRSGQLEFDFEKQVEESPTRPPFGAQSQIKPFTKPNVQFFNPSHISEQNEEDSYHPPESILRPSPNKQSVRLDSLGQQEESRELQVSGTPEVHPYRQPGVAHGQLQPIAESGGFEQSPERSQRGPLRGEQTSLIYPCVVSGKVSASGSVAMGVYEQALEQEIL